MTKFLLSLHVLAAIVAIGPVTVAAGMFPAALRRGDHAQMRTLNRICRVYALLGIAVPVLGLATASSLGVLGDVWLLTSIGLTSVAAAVLGFGVLPAQGAALAVRGATLPAEAASPVDRGAALPGEVAPPVDRGAALPAEAASSPAQAAAPPPEPLRAESPRAEPLPGEPLPGEPMAAEALLAAAARLGMLTGIFNLLWAVVVVLMIVRPGSTTGA